MGDDARGPLCGHLRQGQILALGEMRVAGVELDGSHGWGVVSQTCDVVRDEGRPNVLIAPVVKLSNADSKLAIQGKRPRFVAVPELGDDMFLDLEYIHPVSKSSVACAANHRGVGETDWRAQRQLGISIGRRFARIAMPDEVVPWLSPLSDSIMEKRLKTASPLSRAIDVIEDFRVFSPDWYASGIDLTLYIVLSADELAPLADDEELPPVSPDLARWLAGKQREPAEIAERLFPTTGPRPPAADRDGLWRAFASAYVAKGTAKGKASPDEAVKRAVSSFSVEVFGEDEMSVRQFRMSDQLDLAHLSGPDGAES